MSLLRHEAYIIGYTINQQRSDQDHSYNNSKEWPGIRGENSIATKS